MTCRTAINGAGFHAKRCAKCHENPRVSGDAYCRTCRTDYRRAWEQKQTKREAAIRAEEREPEAILARMKRKRRRAG
jgi:hypothetical protein